MLHKRFQNFSPRPSRAVERLIEETECQTKICSVFQLVIWGPLPLPSTTSSTIDWISWRKKLEYKGRFSPFETSSDTRLSCQQLWTKLFGEAWSQTSSYWATHWRAEMANLSKLRDSQILDRFANAKSRKWKRTKESCFNQTNSSQLGELSTLGASAGDLEMLKLEFSKIQLYASSKW